MNKFHLMSVCLLFSLLWTGCENDDPAEPIDVVDPVNLGSTLTAAMGANLAQQVYIDLSTGETTTVSVNSWELAFEKNGTGIRTNSAKKVAVTVPSETDFASVSTDEGLVYSYDSEDGDLTTTAIGILQTNQPYIIDLGIDENGNTLGKKKFMVTGQDADQISLEFADLDGSNSVTRTMEWDEGEFTFYSLLNDKKVTVEPAEWDLVLTAVSVRTGAPCFTMGPAAMPGINCDVYRLAASAVTNSYDGVSVAKDDPFQDLEQNDDPASEKNQQTIESSNFENLKKTDFNAIGSSDAANAIGRSWLQILQPHRNGIYKIYDFITYIVKDEDDNYYKVRFLAYKGGDNAENGHPTFEYELMTE